MTAQQLTETVFALPPEARHQAEDFLAFLRQEYVPAAPQQTLPALEDEPCFGMWADREDMADSTQYVRELPPTMGEKQ